MVAFAWALRVWALLRKRQRREPPGLGRGGLVGCGGAAGGGGGAPERRPCGGGSSQRGSGERGERGERGECGGDRGGAVNGGSVGALPNG